MKLTRAVFVGIAFFVSLSIHAKECESPLIEWNDYDKTLSNLSEEYAKNKFIAVEMTLECLATSEATFTSGKVGATAVYWFYRNEIPAPGANELTKQKIEKWKETIDNSPYAHFAELRMMYSQAWNERGSKYASETPEDQFTRFKEKLLLAEAAILADKNQLKETAMAYNLLMAVTLDTNGTATSPQQTFLTGVTNWPNYYDFYEVYLSRLVPKWGGSWEMVDAFITHWSDKLAEQEGKSMYARLYYNVHKLNRLQPQETKIDWKKMKPSLIALTTKYPAKKHFEISASYACFFADYEFYKQLFSEHKIADSDAWLGNSTVEICNTYLESISR